MLKANLQIDWPKIILVALAGFVLLSAAAYLGYWYGIQQTKQGHVSVAKPTTTLTPTQPVKEEITGMENAIAFVRYNEKSIWLMNPDGTGQRQIIAHSDYIDETRWSPDRTKLAYVVLKYGASGPEKLELRYFDFDTNESVLVHTFPHNFYIHWSFSWLKDSSGIVYAKRNEIWKYDVRLRENILLNDQIVYTSSTETNNNMYIQTTNSSIFFRANDYLGKIPIGDPTRITEVVADPALDFFSVAPDESFITYTTHRPDRPLYQLVIQRNLQTQEEVQLQEDYGCAGYRPGAYAPDSSRFLLHYQCGDSIEIKIYSQNGTLIRDIRSQKEGMPLHDVLWSPNGSQLFVYFTHRLGEVNFAALFDADGQNEKLLDIQNIGEMSDFSWSSD